MRKCLFIFLLFASIYASAQNGFDNKQFPVKGQLVKVKEWGSRALMILSDNYFSATRDSIIYQVGEEEFEQIKNRCAANSWPEGLYVSGVSEEEDKAFDKKLNGLKMYGIATYTHIYNGKIFDRYIIIRVPYLENSNWDPAVKWSGDVYFLLKEADVDMLK